MPTMNPIARASSSALAGVQREFQRFERAAAQIARSGGAGGTDSVQLSEAARQGPQGSESGSLESALVDVRISKYVAIANLKVMKAADELSKVAESILR